MKSLLATCGLLAAVTLAAPVMAETPRTAAPAGAAVYFIEPANGATISGPVNVRFGLKGMGVAPAGVDVADTGHHHLLVDVTELPGLDAPLPATDNIRHFGKGQTETQITLPPGQHSLQLLLGDKNHIPHQPPVLSEKITITVK
ncbi:DUF4399 domain-containing protein [Geopseudomonas aromaticivorans]